MDLSSPSIGRRTSWVSLGRLLNTLTLLLVGVMLSHALTKAEYGLYQQVWLLIGVAVPLFLFGLPVSINFFLAPLTGGQRHAELIQHVGVILGLALVFLAAVGGFWGLLLAGWINLAGEVVDLLPFAAAIGFGMIACGFWEPFLVIYGHHKALAGSMLLFSSLHLLAVLGGWYVGQSLWWVFACLSGSVAVRLFVSFGVLIERTRPFTRQLPLNGIRELARYVWPVGVRDGFGVLAKYADKVIFLAFFTTAEYAVYINGAWEVPVVGIIVDAMVAVLLPELRVAYHRGDLARMRDLMHFAARRIAFLLFPVAAGAFVIAPDLLALVFGDAYRESGDVFRILVLLVPFRVSIATLVLLAAGRTRAVLLGTVIDLVLAVGVGLALIPWIGMWGPAIALVFSTFCQVCFYLIKAASAIEESVAGLLPWRAMGRLTLLSCGVAYVASQFLRFAEPVANVLVSGGVFVMLLLLLGFGLRMFDATERGLVVAAFAAARGNLAKVSGRG